MTTTTHLTGEQLAHVRDTLDAMRAAGPEHFNMDRWFVVGPTEQLHTLKAYRSVRIDDCGTTACLAGFAALTADATDTMPVYDDTEGMRAALAEWLGMSVGLPAHCDSVGWLGHADDWFYVGCWPQWAHDMLGCWPQWARDMLDDERPVGERERHAAEFKVITQVMDDLVHGVRCNWWDDDLSAVEHADLADAQEA